MRNKRGEIFIAGLAVVAIITFGFIQTVRNGVFKKNMQKIGCKASNQGNAFCDAKYGK